MLDLNNKKIDWTNFNILTLESKQDIFFNNNEFGIGYTEISAEEYFIWAKESIRNKENITTREIVEIISNIKRCIDCKCESFLKTYGFTKNIDIKNYPYLKELIKKDSISFLSLTSYLLDLNLIIIDEIRKLRNKTEHDYTRPTFDDAERAVAIGELFLLAFRNKIDNIRYYCEISSKKNDDSFYISMYRTDEVDPFYSDSVIEINNKALTSNDIEYVKILKILINGEFLELPLLFNKNIPINKIRYTEYFDEELMSIENDIDDKYF